MQLKLYDNYNNPGQQQKIVLILTYLLFVTIHCKRVDVELISGKFHILTEGNNVSNAFFFFFFSWKFCNRSFRIFFFFSSERDILMSDIFLFPLQDWLSQGPVSDNAAVNYSFP